MPIGALRSETPHFGLCGASKEKELVEVTVTRQFRLLRRQAGVLRQFPRRQRPQRHHRNAGFRGQLIQSLSCGWLRLRNRQTRETAKAHGLRRAQVEIALRKVDAAASFRDEWVVMAKLSARIVNLQAGAGGNPNDRDGRVFQPCAVFVESWRHLPLHRHQGINIAEDDRGCLKQGGSVQPRHCSGLSAAACFTKKRRAAEAARLCARAILGRALSVFIYRKSISSTPTVVYSPSECLRSR